MNSDPEKAAIEIETALSSRGKLKILRLLMKKHNHAFTRYEIKKKTPLSSRDIKSDLQILVKVGWINQLNVQHIQKYSINLNNNLTNEFFNFFKKIRYV
jgi:predicted transcriptional regulator